MEVKQDLSSVKREETNSATTSYHSQNNPNSPNNAITNNSSNQADLTPTNPALNNVPLIPNSSNQVKYNLLLLGRFAIDFAVLNLAFVIAFVLRYNLQIGAEVPERNQAYLNDYLGLELAFSTIFFVLLQFKGFYRPVRNTSLLDEAGTILSTALLSVAIVMILIFIGQPDTRSRLMLVYLVPVSFSAFFLARVAAVVIRRWQWKRGMGVRNLLVVGATDAATRLMQAMLERPALGYHLVGYADDELRFSEWTLPVRYANGDLVPHVGSNQELLKLVTTHKIEEVIIALPAAMHETINEVIAQCREFAVEFTLVPDIFELRLDALNLQQINGVPVIGIKENSLTGWNYVVKRISDVLLALIALAICIVPFIIICIAIKLDSRGPFIHKQTRIGKSGKPFTFYKFRSMYVNADQMFEQLQQFNTTGGATFKMVDDPRRTKVGRFLRRTSLDELPQVFNILFGQMSWVGPRPALDRELSKFNEWQFRRFEVTPGLTGLWQVSGRSNLPFDDMVKLDIYYAENWSLWLDFKILLRTIPAVLSGTGAY
jgi:exopolysaccharide biosynthesis polyprenyl glycosylphosphotransferase